jgi:hypothetical protein
VVQLALSTTSEAMEIVKQYCSNDKDYYQHAITAAVNQYEKAKQQLSNNGGNGGYHHYNHAAGATTSSSSFPSSSGATGAVVDAETGYIYDASEVPVDAITPEDNASNSNNDNDASLLGNASLGPKSTMAFGDSIGIRSRDDIASADVVTSDEDVLTTAEMTVGLVSLLFCLCLFLYV